MSTIKNAPVKVKPIKKRFRMPQPKVKVVNQKAIDVAKDVLKKLDLTRFTQGSYFMGSFEFKTPLDRDAQFATIVEEIRPKCQVCLLGACVLAKARVLDRVTCGHALSRDYAYRSGRYIVGLGVYSELQDVFGAAQCTLMESVFELCGANDRCRVYGLKFKSNKERVRAVMTNLIHNGGVFILPEMEDAK